MLNLPKLREKEGMSETRVHASETIGEVDSDTGEEAWRNRRKNGRIRNRGEK